MIPLPMCKEKLIGRNFGTNFHENSYEAEKSSYLINKKKKKIMKFVAFPRVSRKRMKKN